MASGLTFFNPASILPSPDVAVNPPPRADYSPIVGALGDALQHVRDTVKQKRDMDNLAAETRRLASYVSTQSPQLASYLNDKAGSYDLFTTDPAKERADLMSSTINFLGTETNRIKALQENNTRAYENMYRAKLTSAQNTYDALLRAKQEHEQQENVRMENERRAQAPLIEVGQSVPAIVRRPFAQEADFQQAGKNLEAAQKMGPAEAAGLSFSKNPNSITKAPGNAAPLSILPDQPSREANDPNPFLNNNLGTPPPPGTTVDVPTLAPGEEYKDPPEAPTDKTPAPEPPLLTEKRIPGVNGPWELAPEGSGPTPNSSPPGKPAPTGEPLSLENQRAAVNRATHENYLRIRINRIQQAVQDAKDDAGRMLDSPESAKALEAYVLRGQALAEQLKAMKGRGTKIWEDDVEEAARQYEKGADKIEKLSVAQMLEKAQEENASTLIARITKDKEKNVDGTPNTDMDFPIRARTTKTGIKYYVQDKVTGKYTEDVTPLVKDKTLTILRDASEEDIKNIKSIRIPDPIVPATPPKTSDTSNSNTPLWLQDLIDKGIA